MDWRLGPKLSIPTKFLKYNAFILILMQIACRLEVVSGLLLAAPFFLATA